MTLGIDYVYGVHVVRSSEVVLTHVVFGRRDPAERYAQELSTDPGVRAAAVTEYALDALGRRTPVALYVEGARQAVGYVSDDRTIFAGAHERGLMRG